MQVTVQVIHNPVPYNTRNKKTIAIRTDDSKIGKIDFGVFLHYVQSPDKISDT